MGHLIKVSLVYQDGFRIYGYVLKDRNHASKTVIMMKNELAKEFVTEHDIDI